MTSELDRKLNSMGIYGFPNKHWGQFSVEWNGHYIEVIQNRAHKKQSDERFVIVDIGLWCRNCKTESHVESVVPSDELFRIRLMKLYLFSEYTTECDQKI